MRGILPTRNVSIDGFREMWWKTDLAVALKVGKHSHFSPFQISVTNECLRNPPMWEIPIQYARLSFNGWLVYLVYVMMLTVSNVFENQEKQPQFVYTYSNWLFVVNRIVSPNFVHGGCLVQESKYMDFYNSFFHSYYIKSYWITWLNPAGSYNHYLWTI